MSFWTQLIARLRARPDADRATPPPTPPRPPGPAPTVAPLFSETDLADLRERTRDADLTALQRHIRAQLGALRREARRPRWPSQGGDASPCDR